MNAGQVRPPTKIPQRDLLERINFLAKAASTAAQFPEMTELSQYMGTEACLTAKKANIRTKPKRFFCKKCSTPLVPPFCADILVSDDHIIYECKLCHAKRKVFITEKESSPEIAHWKFFQRVDGKNLETIEKIEPKAQDN